MPIPDEVSRALRGWRPAELSVYTGEYERTWKFCRMHACVSSVADSVSRTLDFLWYGGAVDLQAASADVLELVERYERVVAGFGPAFGRTEEARELDIFMGASEELAHVFARLGAGEAVLMS